MITHAFIVALCTRPRERSQRAEARFLDVSPCRGLQSAVRFRPASLEFFSLLAGWKPIPWTLVRGALLPRSLPAPIRRRYTRTYPSH